MTLEVRIPISPRPAWINRTRIIAKSIRKWYPDAIVTVSCYPAANELAHQMEANYVRYPSQVDHMRWYGTRSEYLNTMMDRYKGPFYGDHIIMLDADVIPVRQFDELFLFNAISGVQAHVSPYDTVEWIRVFRTFGLSEPDMRYRFTGYPFMTAQPRGPFYPNSGMVFGPRAMFEKLERPYFDAIEYLRGYQHDTYWFDQVGLALGIAQASLPVAPKGMRYNFPNDPRFEEEFPEELEDVRFIHAMRVGEIDRDSDFEDKDAISDLCDAIDLTGSNEILRTHVTRLLPELFPDA